MYHQTRENLVFCTVYDGTYGQQKERWHICLAGSPLSARHSLSHSKLKIPHQSPRTLPSVLKVRLLRRCC